MVETPDADLSIGMRQLNGVYTQKYNRRRHQTGHLLEGRFKAILVQKEGYLLELCRYVVLNPVRARMVEEPGAWKWSSYQATAGLGKEPDYLTTDWALGLFSNKKAVAQKQYRQFVREGIHGRSPWNELRGQVILGKEGFIEKFKDFLEGKKRVGEIPRPQRFVNRPGLDEMFRGEKAKGQRDKCIHAAHLSHGYTLKEIADHLGIHYTTVSKVIAKAGLGKK
jgi:hypothetical protein